MGISTGPPATQWRLWGIQMKPNEIEACFAAIETALMEFPERLLPIDADGTKYETFLTTAYLVPADLFDLLKSAGAEERLKVLVDSHGCKYEPQSDGSLKISN